MGETLHLLNHPTESYSGRLKESLVDRLTQDFGEESVNKLRDYKIFIERASMVPLQYQPEGDVCSIKTGEVIGKRYFIGPKEIIDSIHADGVNLRYRIEQGDQYNTMLVDIPVNDEGKNKILRLTFNV